MTLRHPGAPRLLQEIEMPSVASWLGDGSLGLVTQLSGSPGRIAADSFDLSAGGLHATGALLLDRSGTAPLLTGHIAADTLPLPVPQTHATVPLPLDALLGWSAAVQVTAAHVLADQRPVLQQAAAMLGLANGALRLDGLSGKLAGGTLRAAAALDAAAEPPAATLQLDVTGATAAEPLFDLPLDLAGGVVNAHARLAAAGHAPATLLATMAGDITLDAANGTLTGVALGKLTGDLPDDAVAAALAGGSTPFAALRVTAQADHGVIAIRQGALTLAGGGSATIGGTIDLPDQSLDLRLDALPAMPDGPLIGLRLTGKPDAAVRTPELADLTRSRATRRRGPRRRSRYGVRCSACTRRAEASGTLRRARRVHLGDQRGEAARRCAASAGQRRPELLLQRDAGAMAGQREAAFDQPAQSPSPRQRRARHGHRRRQHPAIEVLRPDRSRASSAAARKVMSSASARLPIATALS